MGDFSGEIDVEKLMLYSDDLAAVLKDERDVNNLKQCLHQSEALRASGDADFKEVQCLLEDYQKKIDECKQKTEKAKLEVDADGELDLLQKELEAELEKERVLKEELRAINGEINDLECQRISIEERKQTMRKLGQDLLREQRKLSMYASVTNIIPILDDKVKISGHIVDKDKKVVEKFEFDPTKTTSFETCQSIWKMISQR